MTRWRDLPPDARMLAALDLAGARPVSGSTDAKRNWGTTFANACAVMFANALRENPVFAGLEIRPNEDGSGTESLTGVGGKGQKKVDVIASTLASGLQVAISLKAENFPSSEGTYGKNLTNRLYELQDEVRAIHDYQPRAYVLGVFFLPLEASMDRTTTSSFSRAVAQLRSRSGRLDAGLQSQLNRLDAAFVGLYVPEEGESGARGVVRYFDVVASPPQTGRPRVELTLELEGLVAKIADAYQRDAGVIIEFSTPEAD